MGKDTEMKRKALIVYCTDTQSGPLKGPNHDCANLTAFLKSSLGGGWYDREIIPLNNPTKDELEKAISEEFVDVDYSFVVFSGHGFINTDDGYQYIELADGDVPMTLLKTTAPRQTVIIDACRGYERAVSDSTLRLFSSLNESVLSMSRTRTIYENRIKEAEKGISVMFSSSENESSVDTSRGAAYISSLIAACKEWKSEKSLSQYLGLSRAHERAVKYMNEHFVTNQNPVMAEEKRRIYFPLAVKE